MTAWQEYHQQLRKLWLSAQAPSSRTVRDQAKLRFDANVSHATVNDLLTGRRLGSWPLVRMVVQVLNGDVDHFEALWSAAFEERNGAGMPAALRQKLDNEAAHQVILAELGAIRVLLEKLVSQ